MVNRRGKGLKNSVIIFSLYLVSLILFWPSITSRSFCDNVFLVMILTIIAIQPFAKVVVVHRRPLVWRQLVLKNLPRDKANRKRRNIWMNNKTVYISQIELHNHCTKHAFTANNKLDTAIFMISLKKPTAYRPVQFAILSGKLKLLSIFFSSLFKNFPFY